MSKRSIVLFPCASALCVAAFGLCVVVPPWIVDAWTPSPEVLILAGAILGLFGPILLLFNAPYAGMVTKYVTRTIQVSIGLLVAAAVAAWASTMLLRRGQLVSFASLVVTLSVSLGVYLTALVSYLRAGSRASRDGKALVAGGIAWVLGAIAVSFGALVLIIMSAQ